MRKLLWDESGWEDYLYWQANDKKILFRINDLIKDTQRNPFTGLGKPEPLKGNLSGCWSRRINEEHRLVYMVKEDCIYILQSRFHY
jgi:toxin YoeB